MPSTDNLDKLQDVLNRLQAKPIALPPLLPEFLEKGHAVHFRCLENLCAGTRLDIMSKMRNVENFDIIWERRTTVEAYGLTIPVMSLPDLVKSKKTQRDKDWLMIKTLTETNYAENIHNPTENMKKFWFSELRIPEHLIAISARYEDVANAKISSRPLIKHAINRNLDKLKQALLEEENNEREKDRKYWKPLLQEIENMRHNYLRQKK
jgi:hypothetical protein